MGVTNLDILLDDPGKIYFGGQKIIGEIRIVMDSPQKVRRIILRFLGEARTRWSESKSSTDVNGNSDSETVWHGTREEYFRFYQYVLGSNHGTVIELSAGVHTYPFSYVLPPTLPSAFEGKFGHIRYGIKVTLDRPWKLDHEVKTPFTVISPIDLNLYPQLREAVTLDMKKSFGVLFWKSGSLEASFTIPVRGYVGSQNIPIDMHMNNSSNVHIHSIQVTLHRTVIFKDGKRSKTAKENIVKYHFGSIAPRKSTKLKANFPIPPQSLPSNLPYCEIIDLHYHLKFECCVTGFHSNPVGQMHIILGTVPLV